MAIQINPAQFFSSQYSSALQSGRADSRHSAHPVRSQGTEGSDKAQASSGPVILGKRQSAEETAANILSHVQKGLQQLQSSGASTERLQQRLDAAREGIDKGFKEATGMLRDMGMLDDELESNIADSRNLVEDGLQQLEDGLQPQAQQRVSSGSEAASLSNTLSLQVITRDGDRVQVNFSQSASAASAWNSSASAQGFSAETGWQIDVNGSLDEDEHKALTDLVKDVQSLSEQFFNGDIGAALQSAGELGFSGDELASMSLQLTQTTVTASSRYYQAPRPQMPTEALENIKAPLASYVDQYSSALEKLGVFPQQGNSLISDLVQQLTGEDERMSMWNEFHQGLNSLLSFPADTPAAK